MSHARAEACTNRTPLSLLLVTGGHPYEGSEFFGTFASMSEVRFEHVYLHRGKPVSVPLGGLSNYDVVLFYDFEEGKITPEWMDLLSRGNAYVFLHHALGTFPRSVAVKEIIGGRANFSKQKLPNIPSATIHKNVKQNFMVTNPAHPITCGISDFEMSDEAYDNLDVDPRVNIILKSSYPKITAAAGWTWKYKNKRVVYLQPGHGNLDLPPDHGPSCYQTKAFQELLRRSILWAGGRI